MKDFFSREIDYLRISVTRNCNLRCVYCRPAKAEFCEDEALSSDAGRTPLGDEEIVRVCEAAAEEGVRFVRITGGEPLLRTGVSELCAKIAKIRGVSALRLTTNGTLLAREAAALKNAGVESVNLSLNTLEARRYREITGGLSVDAALAGLEGCLAAGLAVKVNAVLLRPGDREDWIALARLARERGVPVRFIEMMPLGWGKEFPVVTGKALLDALTSVYGAAEPCDPPKTGAGPAVYWQFRGFRAPIGLVTALSGAFCAQCNRLRLTEDGFLKVCLCYNTGLSLKKDGVLPEKTALRALFREAALLKPRAHCFSAQNAAENLEKAPVFTFGG